MSKVSIIIPCRNETFLLPTGETTLQRTIREVHEKARGDYELIIVFDGKPFQYFDEYPKLITIYKYEPLGTRFSLNLAARKATGKYILKLDAHCKLAEGFDITLQEDMEDNWVVAPRMYALDYKTWEWQDNRFRDYFMLRCPFTDPRMFRFQAGADWKQRNEQRQDILIDENMKLHGSAFFMSKDFFLDKLGGLDILNENDVISLSGEETEISLKTWLGPWGGISGLELKERLAASGSTTPVVFLTAQESAEGRHRALQAHCAGVLRKSEPGAVLLTAIDGAIHASNRGQKP